MQTRPLHTALALACLTLAHLPLSAQAPAAASQPAAVQSVTVTGERASTLSYPVSVTANALADCEDTPESAVASHIDSFEAEGNEQLSPEEVKKRLRRLLRVGATKDVSGGGAATHAREVAYLTKKLNAANAGQLTGAAGVLAAGEAAGVLGEGLELAEPGPNEATGDPNGAAPPADALNGCNAVNYGVAGARMAIQLDDKLMPQALEAYRSGQFTRALPLFKQAFDKVGYDQAALVLGNMYLAGQGTARDVKQAVKWYELLALSRGANKINIKFNHLQPTRAPISVEARVRLAALYSGADPAWANPDKARYWYAKAEETNYVPARYVLATMIESAYGGAADPAKAVKLYTDAAEHGYAPAQYRLAQLYGAGRHVKADPAVARKWLEQVAFHPVANPHKAAARFALAEMYDKGDGVARDQAKALALYRLAAVDGHRRALNALATYFYGGELVERDHELSLKLFTESAKRGDAEGMFNTAVMLFNGQGSTADPARAYFWASLAARMGHEKGPAAVAAIETRLTPEQRKTALALLGPGLGK